MVVRDLLEMCSCIDGTVGAGTIGTLRVCQISGNLLDLLLKLLFVRIYWIECFRK